MTAPAGPGSSAGLRESESYGIPGATYRLQLGAGLTFAGARDVPYLAFAEVHRSLVMGDGETLAPQTLSPEAVCLLKVDEPRA